MDAPKSPQRLSPQLIHELIVNLAGSDAVKLVDFLRDKVHVSEFKIADELNISINHVRNLLYRLDEHNLVSSMRKKDKKKGWYEYYWTLDLAKLKNVIIEQKQEKATELRKILREAQNKQYYYCPNGCVRVSAEEALELQFKCPECETVLKQEDITAQQEKIKEELRKLQEDLREAQQAIEVTPDLTIGLKKKKGAKQKKKGKKKLTKKHKHYPREKNKKQKPKKKSSHTKKAHKKKKR